MSLIKYSFNSYYGITNLFGLSLVNYSFQRFFHNLNKKEKSIEGISGPNKENYIIQFTCKRCNNRTTKMFSKHSYEKGIVIIRCEGCNGNHLIADNLGWFNEMDTLKKGTKFNVETFLSN
ncbi:MAG: DNL-type zinc finger protein, partial [archaeon]|nr:DNL-type zinc finger protein [archaeon]